MLTRPEYLLLPANRVFITASIAEAKWFPTSIHAVTLSAAKYVLPFLFVFAPALLLDGPVAEILFYGAGAMLASILASACAYAQAPESARRASDTNPPPLIAGAQWHHVHINTTDPAASIVSRSGASPKSLLLAWPRRWPT